MAIYFVNINTKCYIIMVIYACMYGPIPCALKHMTSKEKKLGREVTRLIITPQWIKNVIKVLNINNEFYIVYEFYNLLIFLHVLHTIIKGWDTSKIHSKNKHISNYSPHIISLHWDQIYFSVIFNVEVKHHVFNTVWYIYWTCWWYTIFLLHSSQPHY